MGTASAVNAPAGNGEALNWSLPNSKVHAAVTAHNN
jgi:hypothetical protein